MPCQGFKVTHPNGLDSDANRYTGARDYDATPESEPAATDQKQWIPSQSILVK